MPAVLLKNGAAILEGIMLQTDFNTTAFECLSGKLSPKVITDGSSIVGNGASVPLAIGNIIQTGVYTPELTDVTNVADSTAYATNYVKVDDMVTVSGQLLIDPTATGSTVLRMAPPIASNFGANEDCGGVFANNSLNQSGGIYADPTTNLIEFKMNAGSALSQGFHFIYTYRIIP